MLEDKTDISNMPATRKARTSGGPATKGGQSTLSFGGRNRVTKNALAPSKLLKDVTDNVKAENIEAENINAEPTKAELGHVTSEAAIEAQAKIELSKPKTEEEILAGKVTDAQIKRYWRAREAERITPRGNSCTLPLSAGGEKMLTKNDVVQSIKKNSARKRRSSDCSICRRSMG